MKNAITRLFLLLFTLCTCAQQGINYKALIKDEGGNVIVNQSITVQFQILQGVLGVKMVNLYQETNSPTTDSNGIVIVNIGEGTVEYGDFDWIDWSRDDIYLNVQIDTGGGLTDMGTTQFMAVPYALQATKTGSGIPADGTEGQILTIQGGVPVWSSPCPISFYSDTDSDGYGDPGNTLLACQPPPGYVIDNTDCDDTDATINPSVPEILDGIDNNCDGQVDEATIGDLRAGGIVFWVDPADNTHGLVCAIEDQSSGIRWNNGFDVETGATGITIGTGSANTDAIIAVQGPVETDYAAGLARAYTGGGFTDWFLPSKDEINQMSVNKLIINDTATANGGSVFGNVLGDYYWSSSERNTKEAWGQSGYNNNQNNNSKKSEVFFVRAVRAF